MVQRIKYVELQQSIKEHQVQRAGLLERQALEARAPLAANVAAVPPSAACAKPTYQQAWAVLQELHDGCSYSDEERAIVSGIAQRVQLQHQQQLLQMEAAAAPIPTSPRLAAAAGAELPAEPAVAAAPAQAPPGGTDGEVPASPPASIPAAQADPPTQTQELQGEAAADGRDEFSQFNQDVAMLPALPAGSVLDREPMSPEQALEDKKRRRIIKK